MILYSSFFLFLCKTRWTVLSLTRFWALPYLRLLVISFNTFPRFFFTKRGYLTSSRADSVPWRPHRTRGSDHTSPVFERFVHCLQVLSDNILEISLILYQSAFTFIITSLLSGDSSFDFLPIFVYTIKKLQCRRKDDVIDNIVGWFGLCCLTTLYFNISVI